MERKKEKLKSDGNQLEMKSSESSGTKWKKQVAGDRDEKGRRRENKKVKCIWLNEATN
jgi:hypothetical protein